MLDLSKEQRRQINEILDMCLERGYNIKLVKDIVNRRMDLKLSLDEFMEVIRVIR